MRGSDIEVIINFILNICIAWDLYSTDTQRPEYVFIFYRTGWSYFRVREHGTITMYFWLETSNSHARSVDVILIILKIWTIICLCYIIVRFIGVFILQYELTLSTVITNRIDSCSIYGGARNIEAILL